MKPRAAADELVQLCSFTLGGEQYVIDIMRIKEIINPLPIRKVPMAPSFVEGVIDLRGSIIPIVDMRKRLGTPVAADGRAMKYIIVSIAGRIVGLVVDAVKEVIRVTRSQLRPAPALTLNENAPIVLGVCAHDGQLLVLLDLDQLLSHAERASLPASAAAGAGAGAGAGGSPGAHPGADPLSAGLPVVDATSPEDGE